VSVDTSDENSRGGSQVVLKPTPTKHDWKNGAKRHLADFNQLAEGSCVSALVHPLLSCHASSGVARHLVSCPCDGFDILPNIGYIYRL
jgi:hypothetical protein